MGFRVLCSAPAYGAEHRTRNRLALPQHVEQSIGPDLSTSARTAPVACTRVLAIESPSTGARMDVGRTGGHGQGLGMDEIADPAATLLVTHVGRALRKARRRRRLSQREFARQVGISKSRLARLESNAGPQSLETASQVLIASGFRLEVVDMSGAQTQSSDVLPATLVELRDAGGRHFPAHLDACPLEYPPLYWFVRNGGWLTRAPFPQWTYQRRFVPPGISPGRANGS